MNTPSHFRRSLRAGAIHRASLASALVLLLTLGSWISGVSPARTDEETPSSEPTAADSADITHGVERPAQLETLAAPDRPFRTGESLKFSVQYGFIKAGTAWLEVPEVRDVNGRPAMLLVARAESNRFFDGVYKVRNRIESLWDMEGRFSWRYLEDRREGKYRANDTVTFDPSIAEARYKNGQTFKIPANAQDALSAFYFTRTQALPIGGSIQFDYHASRKSAPMVVRVIGRQRIKTPAGKFNCIVVEPELKAGGIFKNKGRLVIWLTDDERRMPVLMRSKVLIGSISVVLQEVRSGA